MKKQHIATLLFAAALIFFACEVFLVCTAKSQYDYNRARESADELSVELGLISSAFNSGDRTLFNDSLARYRATLNSFAENEYVHYRQAELLLDMRQYGDTLTNDTEEINELLELSASLSSIRSELQDIDSSKLDAMNFYQIQQTFQTLLDTLEEIKAENLGDTKQQLTAFAKKIVELSKSSAVCVSVCPKSDFQSKQKQLQDIKKEYSDKFAKLGTASSKKYDPSSLIVKLEEL